MNDLKNQWINFLIILFNPIVFVFLVGTIIAIIIASHFSENTSLVIIFSGLASITSGILGGIVWNKYSEINGISEFLKKGKSAVRNLVSIYDQLNRLRSHLAELEVRNKKISIKEIDHHMLTTEKNVISAIEDWVDMSPELRDQADLAQKIAMENDKSNKLLIEIKDLEEEIEKGGAKEDELRKQINDKDKDLESVRKKISELSTKQTYVLGQPLFGTSSSYSELSSSQPNLYTLRICEVCGKQFTPEFTSALSSNRCNNCMSMISVTDPGAIRIKPKV